MYGITVALSIVLVSVTFEPLWQPLLLAAILAGTTHGLFTGLRLRLGDRPRLAAALMTIAVVLLILVPIAALVPLLVRQTIEAVDFVASALSAGGVDELINRLPDSLEHRIEDLSASLQVDPGSLSERAAAGGWILARYAGDILAGVSRAVFWMVMMLIGYYALLLEGPRLLDGLRAVSPLSRTRTEELITEFRKTGHSVLGSTLISAGAQAAIAFVGYLIAGVPNAVFFAFLTLVVALIPVIGTPLVTLPLAAFLLVNGDLWQGLFLAAWGLGVVSLIDNVIKPLVVRGGTRLSGMLVFFSLIGGLLAFGAIGLVVGPLTVTFFMAMVRFASDDLGAETAADVS